MKIFRIWVSIWICVLNMCLNNHSYSFWALFKKLLQNVTNGECFTNLKKLLQSVASIIKWDIIYNKCDGYNKIWQKVITKCDSYYKVRLNKKLFVIGIQSLVLKWRIYLDKITMNDDPITSREKLSIIPCSVYSKHWTYWQM